MSFLKKLFGKQSDLDKLKRIERIVKIKLVKVLNKNELRKTSYITEGYYFDVVGTVEGLCVPGEKVHYKFSDISSLKELKSLTYLDLGSNEITDISSLTELKDLVHLDLHANKIIDISSLKELKSLTHLDLWSNEIIDVSSLIELKSLTHLNLNYNKINDISSLKELKSLTHLYLNYNKINDISSLKELKSLSHLDLRSNEIIDISSLKELKSLTHLDLGSNKISEILSLKEVKSLTYLDLNSNEIRDISSLKELKSLTHLDLNKNQISEILFLEELKGVTTLKLSKNQISVIPKWLTERDYNFVDLSENPVTTRVHTIKKIIKMPIGLELQESFDLLNFFKSNSTEALESKLKDLPIEDLVFDDMLCKLELNNWAVHIVLKLTSTFSTFNWLKERHPELPNLPAEDLTKLLILRLIEALKKNSGKEITPAIENELENVARNLNAGGFNKESTEIYKICKSQKYISTEKRESMEFWIFFNLYRIAFNTKSNSDIKFALEAIKNFNNPSIEKNAFQDIVKWLKENFKVDEDDVEVIVSEGARDVKAEFDSVTIGNQIWMAKNLDVDRFRNGDIIPEIKDVCEWQKADENKQPAWCHYENKTENGKIYGKLYNWFAVTDLRSLAPEGWHVPSTKEWKTLINLFLGGASIAGGKMKSTGTQYWREDATNESGFSGLPGGKADNFFTFSGIGGSGRWWSSSEHDQKDAWNVGVFYDNGVVYSYNTRKGYALSVRCLKD